MLQWGPGQWRYLERRSPCPPGGTTSSPVPRRAPGPRQRSPGGETAGEWNTQNRRLVHWHNQGCDRFDIQTISSNDSTRFVHTFKKANHGRIYCLSRSANQKSGVCSNFTMFFLLSDFTGWECDSVRGGGESDLHRQRQECLLQGREHQAAQLSSCHQGHSHTAQRPMWVQSSMWCKTCFDEIFIEDLYDAIWNKVLLDHCS